MKKNKRLFPVTEEVFNRKICLSSKVITSGRGIRPKYRITGHSAEYCIY
jgi:hypothetical protein